MLARQRLSREHPVERITMRPVARDETRDGFPRRAMTTSSPASTRANNRESPVVARSITSTMARKHRYTLAMGTNAKLVSAAVLLAALCVSAPSARGCSCMPPDEWGFIGGENGPLPANGAGVAAYAAHYWYSEDIPEPEWRFMVEILEAGELRQLPVEIAPLEKFSTYAYDAFLVAPEGGVLQPGATYRFTMEKTSGTDVARKQTLVEVGRETLSKNTEFILNVGPVTKESAFVAAAALCSMELDVSQVRVGGSLAEHAARWGDQLLYRTIVDDAIRWNVTASLCHRNLPGRSWDEVLHDRIISPCPEQKPPMGQQRYVAYIPRILNQGTHTILMQAFLPGTGVVLETAAESVLLSCLKS